MVPFKVVFTGFRYFVVICAHGFDQRSLHFRRANHWKFGEEIVGHSDQGLSGPRGEPVHRTARNQPRKLQRSGAELLPHLLRMEHTT